MALLQYSIEYDCRTVLTHFDAHSAEASVALDKSDDPRIRVNFNITMMDLKCDYAVVDVVSSLGTEQNVSTHVTKWHVDGDGIRRRYQGRNKHQTEIELHDATVTASLDELYANGEDAVSLDAETFEYAKKNQEFLFVDFYASWCSHCRQLAPTWYVTNCILAGLARQGEVVMLTNIRSCCRETLAEVMTDVAEHIVDQHEHEYSEEELEHAKKVELPVMIAKIDCVEHRDVCLAEGLMAYPTLRLFVDGERWKAGDYRGHRTVVEMADWLQQVEDKHKEELGDEKKLNVQLAHQRKCKKHCFRVTLSFHYFEWSSLILLFNWLYASIYALRNMKFRRQGTLGG